MIAIPGQTFRGEEERTENEWELRSLRETLRPAMTLVEVRLERFFPESMTMEHLIFGSPRLETLPRSLRPPRALRFGCPARGRGRGGAQREGSQGVVGDALRGAARRSGNTRASSSICTPIPSGRL